MEQDIIDKIENDFTEDSNIEFEKKTQLEEYMGNDPQVSRCIVHLAKGSIATSESFNP